MIANRVGVAQCGSLPEDNCGSTEVVMFVDPGGGGVGCQRGCPCCRQRGRWYSETACVLSNVRPCASHSLSVVCLICGACCQWLHARMCGGSIECGSPGGCADRGEGHEVCEDEAHGRRGVRACCVAKRFLLIPAPGAACVPRACAIPRVRAAAAPLQQYAQQL
jgi:hypothetical protein